MNREAMLRILRKNRDAGSVALADPPTPATCATSRPSKDPMTLAHPRERLWSLLDTRAGMDEAAWSEAIVTAKYDDIMDIFRDYPAANTWFREWRQAHPEARLC